MKVKVISDGTPAGTRVVSQETGETLEGVCSIDWKLNVGEIATLKIELIGIIPVEIEGDAALTVSVIDTRHRRTEQPTEILQP